MMTLRTSLTKSTPCGPPGSEPLDAVAGGPESPNIPAVAEDSWAVTVASAVLFPVVPGGGYGTVTPSWMTPASPSPQSRWTAYTVVESDRRTTTMAAGCPS